MTGTLTVAKTLNTLITRSRFRSRLTLPAGREGARCSGSRDGDEDRLLCSSGDNSSCRNSEPAPPATITFDPYR